MNTLLSNPGILPLLERAAYARGHGSFSEELLEDLGYCEKFLRELHADSRIPPPLRAELYTALLTVGPGGLQAFSWLTAEGHASPSLVLSYLGTLSSGLPRVDALEESEALNVAEKLFSVSLPEDVQARSAGLLLASSLLTGQARQTVFRVILSGRLVDASARGQLVAWSTGGRIPGLNLPDAPEDLFRLGVRARVQLGEPAELVLRQVMTALEARSDPSSVVDSALDLVEYHGEELERSLRLRTLERARAQADPKVRRRAYQLAEPTEGESFLRLGLRDQDFAVRSWVMGRVSRRLSRASAS